MIGGGASGLPTRLALPPRCPTRARSSGGADGATTARARGTDCFKSPEMLMVGGGAGANREQSAFDRRRRQGAGAASDVWSLGCLLFELVTGARAAGGWGVQQAHAAGALCEEVQARGWH